MLTIQFSLGIELCFRKRHLNLLYRKLIWRYDCSICGPSFGIDHKGAREITYPLLLSDIVSFMNRAL